MKTLNMWIKMGARNLVKNRRRSLFTIGAIALGFAAVNLFGGFTAYIFKGLEEGYIFAFANGHMTVFKKGFLQEGSLRPLDYLLTESEIRTACEICLADPRVELVTPQLTMSGLVSNGKISTVFMGIGHIPSDAHKIHARATSFVSHLRLFEGRAMSDDLPYGLCLSRGLAQKLEMGFDATPIVISPTVDGQMNALDGQVLSVFDPAYETLEDKLIVAPLSFAQSLYDTTSADRLVVLLHHTPDTQAVRRDLERRLEDAGLGVEIRTWQELCVSYIRIRDMFNIMFLFIFTIVFVIVVLSIINTISMAVLERTREIGTLRALGLKRRGALAMFAAESGLLGVFGSGAGMAITAATWFALKVARPQWVPPVFAAKVPFEVYLVPKYIVMSLLFLVALAMCAAVLPARRAARMSIIDALGHV